MSYASQAALNTQPKWLEIFLARDNDTVPYTISEDDLAVILYRRFNFGAHDILKVDMSAMKSIKILVRPEVDLEKHKTTHQIEV